MAKAKNKTQQTKASPKAFVDSIDQPTRQDDARVLLKWFTKVTGLKPKMWGPSIIGYGRYRYEYESGREGEHMLVGFSPRKSSLSVYIMPGYEFESMKEKLGRLGKHKLGKSCLYINKLSDVDLSVLEEIVLEGLSHMRKNYDTWDN